jgi:hypothetical protein
MVYVNLKGHWCDIVLNVHALAIIQKIAFMKN